MKILDTNLIFLWYFKSSIYNYLHLLCKTDEAGTDFLSTFFTFDHNFRNLKDWIIFTVSLDCSLSNLCDFTANHLNGVKQIIHVLQ